jgi:hypothetical protein
MMMKKMMMMMMTIEIDDSKVNLNNLKEKLIFMTKSKGLLTRLQSTLFKAKLKCKNRTVYEYVAKV